jgi:Polysaccharide lyase family 4, domain II
MNAVAVVTEHPYYVVTDETGQFELTNVPAGHYELVAWHEGWTVTRNEATHDVLTEHTVQRPLFSPPRTWQKAVTVEPNQSLQVQFVFPRDRGASPRFSFTHNEKGTLSRACYSWDESQY